jgi:hypothetical protein
MVRRDGCIRAICEDCARPLNKNTDGRWRAAEPLYGTSLQGK